MSRPRIVQKPLPFRPKACVVSNRADGDVIDFGATSPEVEPHIYIRRPIVESAAKLCGMLSESEAQALQSERDELIAENAGLRAEIKVSAMHHTADAAQMAYAGASVASATIIKFNPDLDLPNDDILAAVEELVEPSKEEILHADSRN